MDRDKWLSLGLNPDYLERYNTGNIKNVEAHGLEIVGIAINNEGYYPLGKAEYREEAVVIATILRIMM